MRKLGTIQIVKDVMKHSNADTLEIIGILGWRCVSKLGTFKQGDRAVYFETDSVLPEKEWFKFLENMKGCKVDNEYNKGYRLRLVRLRGEISQGLCLPFSSFPEEMQSYLQSLKEGEDVTDYFEVKQYILPIPACIAGEVKGNFPHFCPKTDETRIQLLQEVLDRYKGTECYYTEKIDGCSVTYALKDGEFFVCSRNLDLKDTEGNAFWQFAKSAKIKEKLLNLGKNIAFQGELFGQGLQGNSLKQPDRKVLFFNVFDIDKYKYYDFEQFKEILKELELESVPILDESFILINNIVALVNLSVGKSKINSEQWREGIVIRPKKEIIDLQMSSLFTNGRLSLKAINPEYLLEVGE